MFEIMVQKPFHFPAIELKFGTERAMYNYTMTWATDEDEIHYYREGKEYTPWWAV